MFAVVREVQVPLLAVLLIGASAAKAASAAKVMTAKAGHATGMRPGAGPAVMFPPWLRLPAVIGLCAAEFVLGTALLLTAGRVGAGAPALVARAATGLLFGTAAGALHELRARRPEAGCGCFGELSRVPVSWRAIARAALLCAAALSSIGLPPLRMPGSPGQAWLTITAAAAELAVLGALSPEIGQVMIRLSQADPCELREVPVGRTLAALRASRPWRRYQQFLVTAVPADVWREGCWRFVVFHGMLAGRHVDVVFAVHLAGRGMPVRVGMLDADVGVPPISQAPSEDPLQMSNRV